MDLKSFRRRRIQEAMKSADVQILVASLPQNIAYLTGGYVSVGQNVLCSSQAYAAYVLPEDQLYYIVGHAEIPSVLEFEGEDARIVPFGAFRFSYEDSFADKAKYCAYEWQTKGSAVQALMDTLGELAEKSDLRIALDTSRMPYETAAGILATFPYASVSGAGVFYKARMIKAPEEIEWIARSAQVAEQALLDSLQDFRPGDTEQDLGSYFRRHVAECGAKDIFCVVTANKRAAFCDTVNQPVPIERGSFIRVDYGCDYQGYTSDLSRTICVGTPDEKVVRLYDAIRAGTEAAIAAARPGVRAGELFQIAVETTRRCGIPEYRRHHVGHCLGLEVYDDPSITPDNQTVLQAGMVLNIETPYYELGWGGVQVEDTVAITENGAVRLDLSDNHLIVLDV